MSGAVHAPESQEHRPQALGLPPTPSGSTQLRAGEKTSKTRLGAGRGFFICFPHLTCLLAFEVLLKLSLSLICGSPIFAPRFGFSHKRPREGWFARPRERFCSSRGKFAW